MAYQEIAVAESRELAPGVRSIAVPWTDPVRAGQFFMLRRKGASVLLPRAVSVCAWDGASLLFCIQLVGPGTEELGNMKPGDLLCLTGPLGNGFPVEELSGRVALVGGGIGVAPLLHTARELRAREVEVHTLAGFRDHTCLTGELESASHSLSIATENGAAGKQGFVTALLEPEEYDAVLCCGPEPMMRAVTAQCAAAGTPVYVSLENRMACGLGACLVCTCADKNGHNRRTCKEGPVFRGEEIDFDA